MKATIIDDNISINRQIIDIFMEQPCFAIQIVKKDGSLAHYNETFLKLWNLSEKDISKFNIFKDKLSKKINIIPLIKSGFRGKISNSEDSEFCIDPVGEENNPQWFVPGIFPLKDENQKINLVVVILKEITQKIEVSDKLREKKDSLLKRELASKDGLWDWDLKTNKVYFDKNYYNLAGYEDKEFPYELEEFKKRIHPDDIKDVMEKAAVYLGGGIDKFTVQFRFMRKNSDWMWILGRGVISERAENGDPLTFTGIHTDISKLMKIENELKENLARLDLIVNSLPIALYTTDVSEKLRNTWISNNVKMLTGYSTEEMISKDQFWEDRIHPQDKERVQTEYFSILDKEYIQTEYRWRIKSGVYKWFQDKIIMIRNEDGSPKQIIGIWIDIDENKEAEEELKKLKDSLESRVEEQTVELRNKITDLQRFHDATIDRELRMKELYDEITELKDKLKN